MSDEESVTVPDDGDRQARANSPHAVAARKDHDGDVNERLENVKEPKFGNDHCRHNQGDREERGCDWNPNARCRDPGCRITVHGYLLRQRWLTSSIVLEPWQTSAAACE
jgi:hypothetical protein